MSGRVTRYQMPTYWAYTTGCASCSSTESRHAGNRECFNYIVVTGYTVFMSDADQEGFIPDSKDSLKSLSSLSTLSFITF